MAKRGKSPRQKIVVDIDKVMKQLNIKKSRYDKFVEQAMLKEQESPAEAIRKRVARSANAAHAEVAVSASTTGQTVIQDKKELPIV